MEISAADSSETLAQEALSLIAGGYWLIDLAAQKLLSVSDGFYPLLGLPSEKNPQNHPHSLSEWLSRCHRSDQAPFQAFLANPPEPGSDPLLQVRMRNLFGIWTWLQISARRLHHNSQTLMVCFQDISHFKEVETAAIDSQIRYHSLHNSAPLGLILWNREGLITGWNGYAEKLLGWTEPEVIGKKIHQLLLPKEQINWFADQIRQLMRREGEGRFATATLPKNGSTLRCEWSNVILRSASGKLIGIMSLILDVTEQWATQAQFREIAHMYRALVETSPDAILLADLSGQIIMANQQSGQLFGHEHFDDLVGRPVLECVSQNEQSAFDAEVLQQVGDYVGFVARKQLSLDRLDKTAFTAELSFTASANAEGEATGLIIVARDITEQIQRNNELTAHRFHLESLVKARTQELDIANHALSQLLDGKQAAEDALIKAKDMAVSLAQMKTDFLSNMSHELRTPMNAVIGFTHLLQKSELNDRQHEYISKIRNAGTQLLHVVNDVLDFSKIEAGQMQLEQTAFDLERTLDTVMSLLQFVAEEKGLQIHCQIAPDVPPNLTGDPHRLSQILTNLLSNAVKFTHQGSVCIRVSCKEISGQQIELAFSVQDTGIGMTEAQRSKLFSAFSQADASITRQFGGTGLGLVISKKLIEIMGGSISLESTPNQGSTFTFTACFKPAAPNQIPSSSNVAKAMQHHDSLVGLTILVAEDIPTNQMILQDMLSSLGAKVVVADNGQIAINKLLDKSEGINLVLMDVQMPVLDGLAATRRIRSEISGTLPIIAMTAHAMDEGRSACKAAGMNDFLTKPINPEQLEATLLDWKKTLLTPMIAKENAVKTNPLPSSTTTPDPSQWNLPGIEVDAGLKRMVNKPALYEKVLRDFHKRFVDEMTFIQQSFANDDHDDVKRRVHNLKGLAGSISAKELHATAIATEQAIKTQTLVTEALEAFAQEHHKVLSGIARQFGLNGLTITVPDLDRQASGPDT